MLSKRHRKRRPLLYLCDRLSSIRPLRHSETWLPTEEPDPFPIDRDQPIFPDILACTSQPKSVSRDRVGALTRWVSVEDGRILP